MDEGQWQGSSRRGTPRQRPWRAFSPWLGRAAKVWQPRAASEKELQFGIFSVFVRLLVERLPRSGPGSQRSQATPR